jgi:REP element-mobilizing transposase RayT
MSLLGYHLVCSAYGFWLPNDERGSGSDFVRASHLTKFGPANPVSTRRSVAHKPFDFELRRIAESSLIYPPVQFTREQIAAIARGFENEISTFGGDIHACAIMPEHFHMVIGPHPYDIRRFAGRLKGAATKQLREEGLHPFAGHLQKDGTLPSPWARLPWVVYLWSVDNMRRTIAYVENHPVKHRMPPQRWSFVKKYQP